MTDSRQQPNNPDERSVDPKPDVPAGPQPAGPDDLYGIAEPEPESPEGDAGVTRPEWYVAVAGGQREGPLALLELQQRATSNQLARETLVWKGGMSDWVPAGSIAQLFEPSDDEPPPPLPPAAGSPEIAVAKAVEAMGFLDQWFATPKIYRTIGRVSVLLGMFLFLVALLLLPFGPEGSAIGMLTAVLLCAGIFLGGEAAGAILQVLGRIETPSETPSQSEDEPS